MVYGQEILVGQEWYRYSGEEVRVNIICICTILIILIQLHLFEITTL